jgi:hypothetical protein
MIFHGRGSGTKPCALAATLGAVLAACSGLGREPPKVDENLFPADYKKEIVNIMPSILADPTNIRGAFISEPALTSFGASSRYTACVRYNARKSRSEYSGSQDRLAIFHGGQLNQFIPATAEQCGKAAYQPFPELEKICFQQKCS